MEINYFERNMLVRSLVELRDIQKKPEGLLYKSGHDFVLQHGQWYEPRPFPSHIRQGASNQCFGNALVLAAAHGYKYVEGYALRPEHDMPIHHGWNADDAGLLIDNTWMNMGRVYLGVELSVERADDATWNGDASVLNDNKRGYPLFRQRWLGEPEGIKWPPSPRIEIIRQQDVEAFEKYMREQGMDPCQK